ncbi:uncharacterized protein LOC110862658 [Folsomia candida]|uniref:Uncharacterized protein n=1 Tax=Folsomia candida TaxID=158441 RepID=A0A226CXD1_FOLCA|nr:uncharacterized protein LOC110862658 [Folsomia candida]OXA37157.1 hypothetical protein Fcan01_28081 [Folsomia candida]
MSKMLLRFLLVVACLHICRSFVQEITFYTRPGSIWEAKTFTSKEPDLTLYQPLLADVTSYCARGFWRGFHWPNYHNFKFRTTAYDGNLFCENVTLPTMMSLRYLGPLDVSTPSFSVYGGTYESNWGGEEKTFTGLRANDFGFPPKGITITGGSSWTVFSNNNYTGTATCYNSSLLIYKRKSLKMDYVSGARVPNVTGHGMLFMRY